MDILWVTPQLPCRRSGGQVRQYHLLKYLCQKHRVIVLSLVQEAELEELQTLRQLGAEVVVERFTPPPPPGLWRNRLRSWCQLLFDPRPHYAHTYPLAALRRQLRQLLSHWQPDIVQFEHLFVAPLGERINGLPWLLAEQNIEHKNHERQGKQAVALFRRLAGWIETQKLRHWEQQWVQRSTACLAVSEAEATDLRTLAPQTPVYVVPNGVDTTEFAPPIPPTGGDKRGDELRRTDLLFFGTLGYRPNVDAVVYFCREMLPHIQTRRPDVTLNIIGAYAPPEVVALGNRPGVRYLGFVADVRPYLWQAAICIVPLRGGGGTRLKILEALAAGCPVVSTTIGAEGLELVDGRDLLIADDPLSFARRVLQLLAEPNQARSLARQGRQTVAVRYDWQVIAPQLEEAYQATVMAHQVTLNGRGRYYA